MNRKFEYLDSSKRQRGQTSILFSAYETKLYEPAELGSTRILYRVMWKQLA